MNMDTSSSPDLVSNTMIVELKRGANKGVRRARKG